MSVIPFRLPDPDPTELMEQFDRVINALMDEHEHRRGWSFGMEVVKDGAPWPIEKLMARSEDFRRGFFAAVEVGTGAKAERGAK